MRGFLVASQPKPSTGKRPVHLGSPEQQEKVDYIWLTYHDETFLYLAKAENGNVTHDRKHPIRYWCNRTNSYGYDWGLYGISDCYHPKIVGDKRFFSDWRWQVDEAYKLYKGGTKFYGRARIPLVKKFFKWEV